mgnify:CR=1 FL=1
MEETAFSYSNQPKKSNKTMLFVVIGVLLAVLIGWFFITQQPKNTDEVKNDVVVEEKTPTPTTEKPKIEKSSVKIQVINGTGTPGQAGIVVKALEDAGYSTENIKTSNAEEFDNETTTIEAKENFEEIVKNIEDELGSTFDKITVKSSNIDSDSEFDIVIVTGGKIFETVTPTTSVTVTVTTTPTLTPTPTP